MVRAMQAKGAKRLGVEKNSRAGPGGARVQKTLKVLQVGDYVRAAIEILSKDTGMTGKRPYPKQRWSSKVYRIARVIPRKIGFARYQLSKLPRQRFEREDLQLVRRSGQGPGALPEADDRTEAAVAKQAAKRSGR